MENEAGSIADYLEDTINEVETLEVPDSLPDSLPDKVPDLIPDSVPDLVPDLSYKSNGPYWTPSRIFIAIIGGVLLIFIITYIHRAFRKGDYFIKNTFDNDMKFIRHRLGLHIKKEEEEETGGNTAVTRGNTAVKKGNTAAKQKEKPHKIEDLPPTKKNGWCYVGTDRGIRSCIDVGYNETCISQDIYPTREKCINPNLRYD